jgi:endonuclease/exonuclease/phosphatase family metal-dependent hydrolase
MVVKPIKLININVWFGMNGQGWWKIGDYETRQRKGARLRGLVSGLKALDPDIITIQEANKLPAYAAKIARALGYDAVWKVQNSGIKVLGIGVPLNFTAGNVILAKKNHHLKYISSRRLSGRGFVSNYFSFHFKEMRNAMVALVKIAGRPILIFNVQTHFSLIWEQKWEKAVDDLMACGKITDRQHKIMKKTLLDSHNRTEQDIAGMLGCIKQVVNKHDYPYVVAGDFNTTLQSEALKQMVSELGLSDPYQIHNPDTKGYTWDPRRNTNTAFDGSEFRADGKTLRDPLRRLSAKFDAGTPRRIDFIFLSQHFNTDMIQRANLVFTEPVDDLYVSDHFGVEVVLEELPF